MMKDNTTTATTDKQIIVLHRMPFGLFVIPLMLLPLPELLLLLLLIILSLALCLIILPYLRSKGDDRMHSSSPLIRRCRRKYLQHAQQRLSQQVLHALLATPPAFDTLLCRRGETAGDSRARASSAMVVVMSSLSLLCTE
jgi:hypothetical protein